MLLDDHVVMHPLPVLGDPIVPFQELRFGDRASVRQDLEAFQESLGVVVPRQRANGVARRETRGDGRRDQVGRKVPLDERHGQVVQARITTDLGNPRGAR